MYLTLKIKNTCNLILLIAVLVLSFEASALQFPKPISGDHRIRTYVYNPNEVFIWKGFYRYQSSIELDPAESVKNISMGDPTGWQIKPSGTRIFLKPIDREATTNMTIITNKRIYHFELYADDAEGLRDEEMVFSARFIYPDQGGVNTFHREVREDDIPSIEDNIEKYNFNYTITGSENVAPTKIFSDNEFTYMEFRDKNSVIPAIFMVNKSGKESLVNYRMSGDYVVIERVVSQFTLRYGDDVTCVFNESKPLNRKKPDDKILGIF